MNSGNTGPQSVEIRLELERILSSAAFRGSRRCQDFLTFVVHETLEGDPETLKERTLAVKIFGRSAGASLADDSIVRVGAREVRKRLGQYYGNDGAKDPVRIELPAGSYVPAFRYLQHPSAPPAPAPVTEPADEPPVARPAEPPLRAARGTPAWVPLSSGILLASIIGLAWFWMHRPAPEFDSFWRPVLEQTSPVRVVVGSVGDGASVGPGEAAAAFRLAGFLGAHAHSATMQLANGEARGGSAAMILVGPLAQEWVPGGADHLRYRFSINDASKPALIDSHDTTRRWTSNASQTTPATDDYLLLCRVPHAADGRVVLLGAGTTRYGTEQAARILTDPETLSRLLRSLPGDWPSKNVQLVLRSQKVGSAPIAPELIASQVW